MKHILITGSTDGIGKLLALRLAKEGHYIAIHGRSESKLTLTLKEIKEQANTDNVIGFLADFSDLNDVKKMASEVILKMPKIDVLVNNAGVLISNGKSTTTDIRLLVNYFAPYVLTNGLLANLKASDAPRIVNLSSAAQSTVNIQALEGKTSLGANEAYAQSKLALTMWSFYLAVQEPSITVVAVNPGSLLNTKMAKEAYGQHWSPADKGVDILYDLSMTDLAKTGKYFDNDKGTYASAHSDAYDTNKIEKLIEVTISNLV
ncbi:SDR family NAD(P)-dependent oxidoreductase [Cellulophaga lytica]|uniref:Short-chain dehydrogenase/reductase SDR n=1 Tax=Cellulophaga lytica (strain ATCC 23178 / DSM 7489 / JCM 8516 / NBRC 14961 / NCIMB 1423 / VKM B-1433 / Cy l20) TaxID=867900 RepID=F0RBP0_CELLC|nr:SDR family NAD(P)-dependent oxidoreductase [Cellulophaga lytica]ADY30690.1 short-chain dehydrogenase/reductase SDR [Cellulophaga lytica DSM 7489]AIM61672.1 short-chain dehydrogenase [Cellulophaga lytica]WQG78384.1 SDR family NAD(P)-dependent oxidoreductase [Cellulophaga lytica]